MAVSVGWATVRSLRQHEAGALTEGTLMANSNEAQTAIYGAIIELLDKAQGHSGTTRSAMVRDAAIAYRATLGGQQPGSVVVESK